LDNGDFGSAKRKVSKVIDSSPIVATTWCSEPRICRGAVGTIGFSRLGRATWQKRNL
jgi:hypothetical protein